MMNLFASSPVPVNPLPSLNIEAEIENKDQPNGFLPPLEEDWLVIQDNEKDPINHNGEQKIPSNDSSSNLEDDWIEMSEKQTTAEGYEYSSEFKGSLASRWEGTGLMSMLEHSINNQTVMIGTQKKWEKKRLVEGKLASLSKIGSEPVLLTTLSGNQIDSCYFSGTEFFKKINALGGKIAQIEMSMDHPFYEIAEPVNVKIKNAAEDTIVDSSACARIPYQQLIEKDFYNIGDFLDMCKKMSCVPIWEDTLEPVQVPSRFSWYSRQKNMIVMQLLDYNTLSKLDKAAIKIEIEKSDKLNPYLSTFNGGLISGNVIAFENNSKDIKELLDDLKINKTKFEMLEMDGHLLLVNKNESNLTYLLGKVDANRLTKNPIFNYVIVQKLNPDLSDSGVVVLSMNQSNIYSQYTHEILTFLMEGINVLVYDNAGKGLSQGSNNQQGLKEAVEIAGEYLKSKKGFPENKIMFKGQCAGGLPSSEASRTFPDSHVWIDQSPQNFTGLVGEFYADLIQEQLEEENKQPSNMKHVYSVLNTTSGIIGPMVSMASKLVLPSFDVNYNLYYNKGAQIYTIGVPDEKGQGGDKLVPEYQSKAIKEFITSKPNGNYLPMPGATHVTDWWRDSNVYNGVLAVLDQVGLRKNIFSAKQALTNEELVNQTFEALMGSPYDQKTESEFQDCVYQLISYTVSSDIDRASLEVSYIRDFYKADQKKIFKTCLDLSRQLGNKTMTLFFIDQIRNQ